MPKSFDIYNLHNEALERELIYPGHRPKGSVGGSFYFDSNSFACETPRDPAKVLELVLLVREYARGYEHEDLLCLIAEREELQQNRTRWFRAYHANASRGSWVSLADWLSESGHPYAFPRE